MTNQVTPGQLAANARSKKASQEAAAANTSSARIAHSSRTGGETSFRSQQHESATTTGSKQEVSAEFVERFLKAFPNGQTDRVMAEIIPGQRTAGRGTIRVRLFGDEFSTRKPASSDPNAKRFSIKVKLLEAPDEASPRQVQVSLADPRPPAKKKVREHLKPQNKGGGRK